MAHPSETQSTALTKPEVSELTEAPPKERSPEEAAYRVLMHQARTVAESGLFGMKTAQQALALMLISQAEGRHPALAARDYDIIQGRPSKKAEAMLRDFLSAGGTVEWHTLTDTKAEATFAHPQGGSVRISWDMERVKKAGMGGKDMYLKYPRQMLRSRVVSEGVRTVYPAATSGMYVPEEVQDIVAERSEKAGTSGAEAATQERKPERGEPVASPLVSNLKDADLTALSKRPAALDDTAEELAFDRQLAAGEKKTAKAGK